MALLLVRVSVVLACCLTGSSAAARKRIAVMPFSGPRADATTTVVRRALASRFVLVNASAFARASRSGGSGAAGRRAGARAMGVAAIVSGTMTRVGGRWTVRTSVFSGRTGASIGGRSFPLRGTRIDASTARRIGQVIAGYVDRARAPATLARRPPGQRRPPPQPVQQPQPVQPQPVQPQPVHPDYDDGSDLDITGTDEPSLMQGPQQPTVAALPPKVAAHQPPLDNASEAPDEDMGFKVGGKRPGKRLARYDGKLRRRSRTADHRGGEDVEDDRRSRRRKPWQSIVEVSAGLILLKRSFSFNEPVQPQDPADYRTPGVVPALRLEGAVYPLAALTSDFLAGVGLAGRFYRVLGLKSRVDGSATLADTTVQELEVGLRHRWNILGKSSSPTLRFGVDYGQLAFSIVSNQIALPNIDYSYLKLALVGIEVPIVHTRAFSFGALASFDYLIIFSAGDIERTDSGGYGESSTGGIDIGGGLFASYRGFFARATGFYRRFFYAFDGLCWRLRTGCNYAGGALDIYAGGAVNLGYAY